MSTLRLGGKSVPPGTNLQLTECDDDWQEQEETVSQHPHDSDINQHRRYLQQTGRRMPARYHDDSSMMMNRTMQMMMSLVAPPMSHLV